MDQEEKEKNLKEDKDASAQGPNPNAAPVNENGKEAFSTPFSFFTINLQKIPGLNFISIYRKYWAPLTMHCCLDVLWPGSLCPLDLSSGVVSLVNCGFESRLRHPLYP